MAPFIDPRLKTALAPFWPDLSAVGSHVGGAMVAGTGALVSIDDPATGRPLLAYADAGNRVSQRTIWPFAMAFLDDRRLLVAWCELRGEFRHFRADRVLGLEDAGRGYPETRHGLLRRWREQEQLRQSERLRQRERTTADRN